jgi:hypothetical protein
MAEGGGVKKRAVPRLLKAARGTASVMVGDDGAKRRAAPRAL